MADAAGVATGGAGAGAGAGAEQAPQVAASSNHESKGDDGEAPAPAPAPASADSGKEVWEQTEAPEWKETTEKELKDRIRTRIYKAKKSKMLDLADPSPDAVAPFRFKLTALPRPVGRDFKGAKLTALWLTNNMFSEIPAEVGLLTGLKTLCLSGNQLTELSAPLFKLKKLQRLMLSRNRIVAIPQEFQALINLTELRLDRNQFSRFPMAITKCRRLTRLGLSHNKITSIPPQIRRLTNLIDADFDNNRIGPKLPPEILRLASLVTLGIANNYLEEAPAFAKRPPGATPLVTVRLHGNRSGKYEVRHESGMVLEGQNIPRRADGFLELRKGVLVVQADGTQKHEVHELEGYLKEGYRYAFAAANWHRRSEEMKILKARATKKPWRTDNRLA